MLQRRAARLAATAGTGCLDTLPVPTRPRAPARVPSRSRLAPERVSAAVAGERARGHGRSRKTRRNLRNVRGVRGKVIALPLDLGTPPPLWSGHSQKSQSRTQGEECAPGCWAPTVNEGDPHPQERVVLSARSHHAPRARPACRAKAAGPCWSLLRCHPTRHPADRSLPGGAACARAALRWRP